MRWKLRRIVGVSNADWIELLNAISKARRQAVNVQNKVDVIIRVCDFYADEVEKKMKSPPHDY